MSSDNQTFKFVFYHYNPSLVAAIIFAVLFALTTTSHLVQLCRQHTWYFIPLAIGGLFELVGYVGRALSSQDQDSLPPYIMQSVLLLVAPALFAASIYMILGRLMRAVHGEHLSIIPVRWLTKVFVGGDVLAFLMQASGGGLQASGSLDSLETGRNVVLGGLFVQLVWFGFFVVVAANFQIRFSSHGNSTNIMPWKRHMLALYISSALILIRSVYRIVEYLQGYNGYLFHHEVYLYVFDATLMFAVMLVFNLLHFHGAASRRSDESELGKL